ncbi:SigB/SigF/SigG family RNA polymerase sigma factor [Streptomyces oceani]|uniref:RNA polymerase subunit sigma n=1 Tax=Streptomyces oceani TaxID=1075402 RepID=A0A1E7JYE5_9ACTN|nr:SigB/SigF/SigG family RNA polymerase sigma factor [Streptomyces oceani]OEU96625.1 RNA polymerase subunit sigma [Streptomyces oceani]
MDAIRSRAPHARHSHHDAPDTAADLQRLATMPEGPDRDALREQIVEAWLPMARRLAGKFRGRGENPEDLAQVAALGLFKAVERYDPELGKPFEPYAIPTIMGEIRRHFRDNTWDVYVPRRVQEARNQVRRSLRSLDAGDGGSPSVSRLAEHSGLSEEDVRTGLGALESYQSASLDAQLGTGEDGYSLVDTLGSTDTGMDAVVYRESVKPRLRRLPRREAHMLYLRFFRDQTQSQIAEELDVSQMHVSRLLARTCARLRAEVEDEEHTPVAA